MSNGNTAPFAARNQAPAAGTPTSQNHNFLSFYVKISGTRTDCITGGLG